MTAIKKGDMLQWVLLKEILLKKAAHFLLKRYLKYI